MKPSVIYLFVSPSGRAYAGRHACDHKGWAKRGAGPLPSGYSGSGRLWAKVVRKHGPAIRWIILRRFGPDAARADIDAAERRAIRLVRHLWSDQCVNLLDGGTGLTSDEALRRMADPARREVLSEHHKRMNLDPDFLAQTKESAAKGLAAARTPDAMERYHGAMDALWADPDFRERKSQSAKLQWHDPAFRAMKSAHSKAQWADPSFREKATAARLAAVRGKRKTAEQRARISAGMKRSCAARRARKALAPFAVPPSIAAPCVCLWAYLPPLRLFLSVSLKRADGKRKRLL